MELPKDVHYLIVKNLPIDLRIALKVKPGRLRASEEVKKEVSRMAKVANHPNKLRYTKVRTDRGVERMIVVCSVAYKFYYAISEDRKLFRLLEDSQTFSPFRVHSYHRLSNEFDFKDSLIKYEMKGGPY